MTVGYLMLYGNGWTQRWAIAPGTEDHIRTQIAQIGTPATGQLTGSTPVLIPKSHSGWRGRWSPPPSCLTERPDRATTGHLGNTRDETPPP